MKIAVRTRYVSLSENLCEEMLSARGLLGSVA